MVDEWWRLIANIVMSVMIATVVMVVMVVMIDGWSLVVVYW